MADKVYYNPSLGLQSITPSLEDETFLFFLEAYYDWMQTTDITFNGSDGPFANGEIITGQDSKATAKIRYVGSNTITVSMKTDLPFDLGEEIVGGTSANSAFILDLSDNVLRKASRIRENKNPEKAQGQFLEYLKGELNKGIPVKTSAERRKLISQLRDFFKSKSTEEAYTFLFRALFNETIELRYPGDDLLRVSDGKFLKQSTIRINDRGVLQVMGDANVVSGNALVIGTNTDFLGFSTNDHFKIGTQQAVVANVINATHMLATTNFDTTANNEFVYSLLPIDIFSLKNKTIRGRTSEAVGVVADVRASTLGGIQYADVTLRLISGAFLENEILEDIDDPSANVIVYGVVSAININDGGTGYAVDDEVIIYGDGYEATAKVTSVSDAPISKIILANTGIGYRNNIEATVNNTGTGGTGFRARISEIANTYTVGANNEYTVGDTVTVKIINRGSGYVALPTITLQDTAVSSLGLLHEKLIRINNPGTLYEVGDPLVFTNPAGFTGNTAVGQVAAVTERWAETPASLVASEPVLPYKDESLLDDFGSNTVSTENEVGILLEQSYYDRVKTEDWRGIGPIERLELAYANGISTFGSGYASNNLPTVTVSSANGIGANLEVLNIQGKSAVIQIDASNNIAGIGSIREITILNQGIDYTTATIDATGSGDGNANLTADISGLFVDSGRFTNDDGKVNYKVIQDSLFYQDFSYVIRSGLSFDRYKEIVKEVVHPAGLEFFGEIVITNTISAVANFTSEIAADRAPRFASLFSFFSLFDGIGLPPPVTSSIIVKIKPVIAYTDQAKAEATREVELELNPIVITAASVIPSTDPRLKGPLQFALGPIDVTADFVFSRVKGEKSLAPVFLTTTSSFVPTEYNVEILSFVNVEPSFIPWVDISANTSIPKQIKTLLDLQSTIYKEYEVDILSQNRYLPLSFGDTRLLSEFAGVTISELANQRFIDTEYPGVDPSVITLSREPSYVDVSMAFFTTIITMETDVKSVEIDINLLQSVAPVVRAKYEIDLPIISLIGSGTYGELKFNSDPTYSGSIGNTQILSFETKKFTDTYFPFGTIENLEVSGTVEVELAPTVITQPLNVIPSDYFPDVRYLQPQVSVLSTTSTEYNIELVPTRTNVIYGDLPIEAFSLESISDYSSDSMGSISRITYPNARAFAKYSVVEITVPMFTDVTMAFYSNIVTMQNDIRTTEIDLELFKSAATTIGDNSYRINFELLNNVSSSFVKEYVIQTNSYTDVTMAFYSNIVTMQTEIRTTEIDLELFKSVATSSTSKFVIEILLGDRYKNESISEYSDQSISKYDDEVINDKVAIGRAGFVNGKENFVYGDAQLREFWNLAIEDAEPNIISGNNTFEQVYGNDTVRKHFPIVGTVSVDLQDLANVPIFNLAASPINTYANTTFNDPSGLRPVVIGSNTEFTNDFEVGDYIVIGDERFIVKDIANTEYLEINVSATQNYTNVPAYREIFV